MLAWLHRVAPAALPYRRSDSRVEWMNAPPKATVVALVTPHLLRVVDLAMEAEKGVNVDWHVREAVAATVGGLGDQYNAPALVAAYVEGLENAASQAPTTRVAYIRVLQTAADAARRLRRD
ncbi:hypothetical protein ACFQZQ_04305 [Lysobacter koreensis]|uniref:HEAT repeat domain-containing protein n=1 Tax=Lysobacter koreensis TaxID=266122 RepID=A0ABW2YMY9_9GAMM